MDPGTSKLGFIYLCMPTSVSLYRTYNQKSPDVQYSVNTAWLLVHHESICFLGLCSNSFVDSNVTINCRRSFLQRVIQRGDATRFFVRGTQTNSLTEGAYISRAAN